MEMKPQFPGGIFLIWLQVADDQIHQLLSV